MRSQVTRGVASLACLLAACDALSPGADDFYQYSYFAVFRPAVVIGLIVGLGSLPVFLWKLRPCARVDDRIPRATTIAGKDAGERIGTWVTTVTYSVIGALLTTGVAVVGLVIGQIALGYVRSL